MSSPSWKKPSGLLRRKSSRLLSPAPVKENDASPQTDTITLSSPQTPTSKKRRNPFGRAERNVKKVKTVADSSDCNKDTDGIELLEALDNVGVEKTPAAKKLPRLSTPCALPVLEVTVTNAVEQEEKQQTPPVLREFSSYPLDWSLKTRVRFLSEKSFAWASQMKSKDETAGAMSFVTQSTQQSLKDIEANLDAAKSCLQSCCMYWMHPVLPCMKLFPRIATDKSIGSQSFMTPDIQRSLLSEWTASFTAVFHHLRSGSCPYFYLSCHQFTVLFRQTAGAESIEALLTPTSRGLREALKAEGVDFSMPLNPEHKNKDDEDSPSDGQKPDEQSSNNRLDEKPHSSDNVDSELVTCDSEDMGDDITATDEGPSSWLEDLGIDKAKYRCLDPNKVKLQREVFRIIDHRPESLLLVQGTGATFALFNYLLNCRTCIANTGVQAGIPPTILSPTPFLGATLQALKVKAGSVRQQQTDGSIRPHFSLEIQGPLLPSCLSALHRLLVATQTGNFTATYSVHEPTSPFNVTLREGGEKDETVGEEVLESWEKGRRDEVDAERICIKTSDKGAGETRINVEDKCRRQSINREQKERLVGLFNAAVNNMRLSMEVNSGRQAIKELECHDGKFCWSSS